MRTAANRWPAVWLAGLVAGMAAGPMGDRLPAAEPKVDASKEVHASFQGRRERLKHQMSVELEALARLCSLDESQRQRLEVAARGVVEQVLDEREKAPDPNKPVEWRWEEEGLAAKADLLDHPLWRSTLEEVLTRVQVAALEVERGAVKRYQREAAIRVAGALLQSELRLTEEQRGKMMGLLQKAMPPEFCEPDLDAGAYTHWLEIDDVERVLTKTQFAYWVDLQHGRTGGADLTR